MGFVSVSQGQSLCLYLLACFCIVLETSLFISVSYLFAEIRMFPTPLLGFQLKREHKCKCGGPAWGGRVPWQWVEGLGGQSLCLCPLPSALPASPKPSCFACVPLLQRNPLPGVEVPLAFWCPWVPVGSPLCRCPVSSRRAGTRGSPHPVSAAASVGRAVSSRWLCSQPASHCVVRSRLPMEVSPMPGPATSADGFPAVGRAGAVSLPTKDEGRSRSLAAGPSPAACVPVPRPPPCWAPPGARVAVDFVPASVCSLGGAAFPLRGGPARGAGAEPCRGRAAPRGWERELREGGGRGGRRLPPGPPRRRRRCGGFGPFKEAAPHTSPPAFVPPAAAGRRWPEPRQVPGGDGGSIGEVPVLCCWGWGERGRGVPRAAGAGQARSCLRVPVPAALDGVSPGRAEPAGRPAASTPARGDRKVRRAGLDSGRSQPPAGPRLTGAPDGEGGTLRAGCRPPGCGAPLCPAPSGSGAAAVARGPAVSARRWLPPLPGGPAAFRARGASVGAAAPSSAGVPGGAGR